MGKFFEIIIFTSSYRYYADAILNTIDKDRKLIHHRLYRQHCILYDEDVYLKDLRVLGRDLKDVIIVDNAPYSFSVQVDNGYPILPFYNDKNDNELKRLEKYLEQIRECEDIRIINREKFKLCYITEEHANKYKKICQSINEDYYDKFVSLDANDDIQKQMTEMLINNES